MCLFLLLKIAPPQEKFMFLNSDHWRKKRLRSTVYLLLVLQTTMKSINACNDNRSVVTVLSNAIRDRLHSNDISLCPPSKRFRFQEQQQFSHSTRFKGVFVLPNGLCGSQINAEDHSIWLGTFRSGESPAVAYDPAAIRLRDESSPCNFPWNGFLLNMSQSTTTATATTLTVADEHLADDNKKSSSAAMTAHELFQKELTPSDVGKLNRLVIPKKYAVRYFPAIRMCNNTDLESTDAVDGVEGMMLEFRDREGQRWEFRYCYWRSSQSYVFTKGWSKFVKTKVLSAKDTVVFYRCEERGVNVDGRSCNMIEVEYVNQDRDQGGCSTRRRGVEFRLEEEVVVVEKEEREKKGFKLFGVQIS